MNGATIGLAGGAAGSLAGSLLGVLDAPRRALWGLVPGMHDPESGEAYTGEQLVRNLAGVSGDEESLLLPALTGVLGAGVQTALDPLTFAAGPLGGLLGGRLGRAASNVGTVNRAARAGRGASALGGAADAAEFAARGAAEAAPDLGTVALGSRGGYPTDALRQALSTGNLSSLRPHGGVSGLGTVINRPPSQFLVDQLERQGFGSSILGPEGELTERFLLAGDPATRALFAPRGGHLRQLAEVAPDARGPLHPLFASPVPPPSLGEVLPMSELDELASRSPMLSALLGDVGGFRGLAGLPAQEGADLLRRAATETEAGLGALRSGLAASPLEKWYARLFTDNPLGV